MQSETNECAEVVESECETVVAYMCRHVTFHVSSGFSPWPLSGSQTTPLCGSSLTRKRCALCLAVASFHTGSGAVGTFHGPSALLPRVFARQ